MNKVTDRVKSMIIGWIGEVVKNDLAVDMLVSRTTEKARISTIIKGEHSAHEVTN